jgi:branched-chain amino acid transport system permease protein
MLDLALQLLFNGIVSGSLYALGGASWGIIYNSTSTFHYAASLVFAVAGFTAVMVGTETGFPLYISFLAGILSSIILGCSIELWIYRPLRARGAKFFNIFLASMGVTTAGQVILLLFFSSDPRQLPGFPLKLITMGPVDFTSVDLLIIILCWVLIGSLLIFLIKSKYGKVIRAVSVNREMAEINGLNVNGTFLLAFAIGSGLFGAEAFLFTLKYNATPFMGFAPFYMAFTAVFTGGEGTLLGAAVGGVFLGVAMQLGMLVLPGTYTVLVAFAIQFFVLLMRPKGLFGAKSIV